MCENRPIIFEPGAPEFSGPTGSNSDIKNKPVPLVIDRLPNQGFLPVPEVEDESGTQVIDVNSQRAAEIAALGYPITPDE